ncbi:GNAT family N-acetyltransferase [Antribacter sp. KLBMP9083]|uniref:GNAT family N-acetyltransferase n=1 Tax=Antribacter soli TaxID=2910976 RepID=A0AA41QC23_9MICO|nr:GNAT family N-acetyltransferase [Antribacter soli]MCF4120693.1 GNAT family N-acetyltransferase [Antribacter soli]
MPDAVAALVPWDDPDAVRLRDLQQAELAVIYGDDEPDGEAGDAAESESVDHVDPASVVATVLLRVDGEPVACGSVRDMSGLPDGRGGVHPPATGEIKRMFVDVGHRGRGLSRRVLTAVEAEAASAGLRHLVLECGTRQPEAMGLYLSMGYLPIDRFGVYANEAGSRCFGKDLFPAAEAARAGVGPREGGSERLDLRVVAWDDADAAALRRGMFAFNCERYPDLEASVEARGGYPAVDARMGEGILATLVAYRDGEAVGCASLRPASDGALEVRTVFVRDTARRSGVARRLLAALEDVARENGAQSLVLETGVRQPEAIGLYRALGYRPVLPFPPHDQDDDPFGLYLGKRLTPSPLP